ncbi:hypothetical protein FB45DRAFT_864488 [Roridomyces roridus]|uniref:Uncharacterized protein n=1 Tax=Roridomyces roridus TaxID=1738132 RepID=A0AAD7C1G1_9AGAR|nr:hypothetical protein FB45DRAFT_864488 [Roridomyces roridus]
MPRHISYYRRHGLPTPSINDAIYCPKPGCTSKERLKVKLCGPEGKNAGCYYVNCFNHGHADKEAFWHVFPYGVSPAPTTPPNLPPPPSQPQVMPAPAPMTSSTLPRQAKMRCAHSARCRNPANRLCPRIMCKADCLDAGGCPIHSQSSLQINVIPDPAEFAAARHALDEHRCRIEQIRTDRELALALATPLPPSPTSSQEEDYLNLVARSPTTYTPSTSLMDAPNAGYEYYSPDSRSWVSVPPPFTLDINTNHSIPIRRKAATATSTQRGRPMASRSSLPHGTMSYEPLPAASAVPKKRKRPEVIEVLSSDDKVEVSAIRPIDNSRQLKWRRALGLANNLEFRW